MIRKTFEPNIHETQFSHEDDISLSCFLILVDFAINAVTVLATTYISHLNKSLLIPNTNDITIIRKNKCLENKEGLCLHWVWNGHKYSVYQTRRLLAWVDAEHHCTEVGHLLSLHSREELSAFYHAMYLELSSKALLHLL